MTVNLEAASAAELEKLLEEYAGKQVLIDLWAEWCGPCRAMGPILDELDKSGDAVVVKVDVDANPTVAAQLNVRSIPFMKFWKDGEYNKPDIIGVTSLGDLKRHIS